jgi:mono/diheme cytochrome c family protein
MKPDSSQPPLGSADSRPATVGLPPRTGFSDLACADLNEAAELPGEEHPPLPLWLVTFIGALLFWGGIYLQRYSGSYTAMVYDENASSGQPKANIPVPVDPYVMGKRIFENICAKCHQPDGLGLPAQYPPLVGSEWALAAGPARMIRIVLNGLQGPITVKGVNFNNIMAPLRDTLTDQQIAAAITYVRTQKDWGHGASPVTPGEITDIRNKTKGRALIGSWTPVELLAIPDHEPKQ